MTTSKITTIPALLQAVKEMRDAPRNKNEYPSSITGSSKMDIARQISYEYGWNRGLNEVIDLITSLQESYAEIIIKVRKDAMLLDDDECPISEEQESILKLLQQFGSSEERKDGSDVASENATQLKTPTTTRNSSEGKSIADEIQSIQFERWKKGNTKEKEKDFCGVCGADIVHGSHTVKHSGKVKP